MKKFLLFVTIIIFNTSISAQIKKDSILVSRDTINIHGRVIDQSGNPVIDALVFSEDFDKNYNYTHTKTNKDGIFYLNGINPINVIRVRNDEINMEERLNSSRYLLITMLPLIKREINKGKDPLTISAKRVSIKQKSEYKILASTNNFSFHPFGHYWPASYPGGIQQLYSLIKNNVIYPKMAIEHNIEGIVSIEFTIDNIGNCKDFTIIKDI